MLQFVAKFFLVRFAGFEVFVVGGGLGVGRGFVSFLIANNAKVSRELLFNIFTLW